MTNHLSLITLSDIRCVLSIKVCRSKQVLILNLFYLSTFRFVSFNNKIITMMYFIHTYVLYNTGVTKAHNIFVFDQLFSHRENFLKHRYHCIDGAGTWNKSD